MFNMCIEMMWVMWLFFINFDAQLLKFVFPIEIGSYDRCYLFLQ